MNSFTLHHHLGRVSAYHLTKCAEHCSLFQNRRKHVFETCLQTKPNQRNQTKQTNQTKPKQTNPNQQTKPNKTNQTSQTKQTKQTNLQSFGGYPPNTICHFKVSIAPPLLLFFYAPQATPQVTSWKNGYRLCFHQQVLTMVVGP